MKRPLLISIALLPTVLLGCGHPAGVGAGPEPSSPGLAAESTPPPTQEHQRTSADVPIPDAIRKAVAATDRSAEDRALDEGRKPARMLSFFGIEEGQRVAELAAGGGYTTELLARVVGPEGRVFGQNTPFILDRFAQQPWTERLEKPVMQNVVRVDSELENPLPEEASDLDAVLLVLFYHDTVWFETDRTALNRAVFAALRPGGIYGVVDHSARAGDGVEVAKSLHRIEQSVVEKEIEAAGFVLDAEADFLRNSQDTRAWNASPSQAGSRRGTSDRFVLRFKKPLDAKTPEEPAAQSEESPLPADLTRCEDPRSPMCTREYRPVCAVLDTGVRCVTTPCPSTTRKTYSNACTACADPKVVGHEPGACPEKEE